MDINIEEIERLALHFEKAKLKVNVQPLKKIPKTKLEFYSLHNGLSYDFFETKRERDIVALNSKSSYIRRLTLGYIGKVAGKDNVIKETFDDIDAKDMFDNIRLVSMIDKESYYVYNAEESARSGEYVWDKYRGDIRPMYSELTKVSYLKNKIKTR